MGLILICRIWWTRLVVEGERVGWWVVGPSSLLLCDGRILIMAGKGSRV